MVTSMKAKVTGDPKPVRKKGMAAHSPAGEIGSARHAEPSVGSPMAVFETDSRGYRIRDVETMLSDIVARLERIEEKIDENVYPPESAIKPEFVRKVKKAQADIAAGTGKVYDSMDDFIRAISE